MATKEEFDLIVRARDQASSKLKGVTKNIVGMVAAYATIRTGVAFLKEAIAAAAETETVYNDLNASLERHGMNWRKVGKELKQHAGNMQTATGISDEAIAGSMQMLIDYGSTAAEAQERVKTAMDLAVGGHMDLRAATDLVAKASVGYTATLSRYGIILDESLPKSEKFAAAIKMINERFGGAAQARMKTYAGKVSLLKESWGDFTENVGLFLTGQAGPLSSAIGGLTTLIQKMTEALEISNRGATMGGRLEILKEEQENLKSILDQMGGPFTTDPMANWVKQRLVMIAQEVAALDEMIRAEIKASAAADDLTGSTKRTREEMWAFAESVRDVNRALAKQDLGPVIDGYETMRQEYEANHAAIVAFNDQTALQDELLGGIPDKAALASAGVRILTEEERRAAEELRRVGDVVQTVVGDNLTRGFSDMILGVKSLRDGLKGIFKGIAEDFIRYTIRAMIRAMIQAGMWRLFGGVVGFALGGPGGATVGSGIGGAFGGANYGVSGITPPVEGGLPSGGGPMAASAGGLTINIGTIIGQEQYVRDVFVPILERDARLQMNRLALR
jgi:hypothetical protein